MQSEPRLIEDMSFADYLSDPAPEPSITAGILRELLNGTPRHVWERTPRLNAHATHESKASFDLGSAAHALFVGHGAALDVVQADNWRTNAAKEAKAASYAAGHTPILEKDYARVKEMADAADVAVRPERGDRPSPSSDATRGDDYLERGRRYEPLPAGLSLAS